MIDCQKYNAPTVSVLKPKSIRSYKQDQINIFRTAEVKWCLGENWSRIVLTVIVKINTAFYKDVK